MYFIMTSNAPDAMYSELVNSYKQTFGTFVGPCEVLVSGETVFPQERKKVFETARRFAEKYSTEIVVQDSVHESAYIGDAEYPCVPLKFYVKGNSVLYKELLESGCCTKMEGSEENGKRIRRVLLWLEPNGVSVHELK